VNQHGTIRQPGHPPGVLQPRDQGLGPNCGAQPAPRHEAAAVGDGAWRASSAGGRKPAAGNSSMASSRLSGAGFSNLMFKRT